MNDRALAFIFLIFAAAAPSQASCPDPKPQADAVFPYSAIRIVPGGDNYSVSAGTATALDKAINRWNAVCEDDVPTLSKTASSGVKITVRYFRGRYSLSPDHPSNTCASVPKPNAGTVLGSTTISIYEQTRSGLDCTGLYDEITYHEIGHALGLDHSSCSNNIMYDLGGIHGLSGLVPKREDCKAVDRFWLTPSETTVTPPPPPCNFCSFASDCDGLPGTGTGIWTCRNGCCILLNSPLVLHLPDYLSSGSDPTWWEESFCGPDAPIVCLDWKGDGEVTCNTWTKPGSGVAFVVALSPGDLQNLTDGFSVRVEPWRHLFGNVTMGTAGDFPFAHGFSALSAHCGLNPGERGFIDFSECAQSLHVWEDRSGEGDIDPGEALELADLDIETLGGIQKTDKRDACGNLFPFESKATCNGRDGRCGFWLDVFFEPPIEGAPIEGAPNRRCQVPIWRVPIWRRRPPRDTAGGPVHVHQDGGSTRRQALGGTLHCKHRERSSQGGEPRGCDAAGRR